MEAAAFVPSWRCLWCRERASETASSAPGKRSTRLQVPLQQQGPSCPSCFALLRQEGTDPTGTATLPASHIPQAARRHRDRDREWWPSLCTRRGLGTARHASGVGLASAFGGAWLRCPGAGCRGGQGEMGAPRGEMERSLEGAGIRICRGGIVLTDLALVGSVCGAGGVRQLGGIRLPAAQSIKGQEIQKLPSKPCHPAQPGGCLSPPPTPAG